jgi:hypothetical protein
MDAPPVKARARETLLPATAASSGVIEVLTMTSPETSAPEVDEVDEVVASLVDGATLVELVELVVVDSVVGGASVVVVVDSVVVVDEVVEDVVEEVVLDVVDEDVDDVLGVVDDVVLGVVVEDVVELVVVGYTVVDVVVVGFTVEVVVGFTVVVVVGFAVVVVTGVFGPQNCRFEMSGVLPRPTSGRSLLENVPEVCGGVSVVVFDPGPPLTMIAEMGVVEVQTPPLALASLMATTFWLPLGFSNLYLPPEYSNLATSTVPSGHSALPPCDEVVDNMPTTSMSAPTSAMAMPPRTPPMPWCSSPASASMVST